MGSRREEWGPDGPLGASTPKPPKPGATRAEGWEESREVREREGQKEVE